MKSYPVVQRTVSPGQYADEVEQKRSQIAQRDEAELAFYGKKQLLKVRSILLASHGQLRLSMLT